MREVFEISICACFSSAIPGPPGATGATGPSGSAGATGSAGPAGPAGATGPAGTAGTNGVDGATGPAGTTGPSGASGATGPSGPGGATAVAVLDTNCVDMTLTGTGVTGDPYTFSAVPIIAPECNGLSCTAAGLIVAPSTDAGNTLACGTDGNLFVPTGAATVSTAASQCITVSGDGSIATPVTAVPIIDPSAQNALTCGATGLLVDVAATALDTTCINTTVTGNGTVASPFVISSVPIIDPACPLLTCGAAGLCVAPTAVAVVDTPSLDLTLTGTGEPGSPWTISGVASATVVTGPCGVSGAGTIASPIVAKVSTWPYACPQDANATAIYCSPSSGTLQGPPVCPVIAGAGGGPAPGLIDPVPLGTTIHNQTFPAFTINNPSACLNVRMGFAFAARLAIDYRDFGGVHNGFVNFQFSPDNLGWNNAVAQNNNWVGDTNMELDFTFPPNQLQVTIPAGGSQQIGTRYVLDPDGATNARAIMEFGTVTYQSLGCV